jgi:hypothetical protein
MTINDIANNLPKKVKLNKNFKLDESFDPNTIILVKGVVLEDGWDDKGEKCYKVFVTALAEDMEYNRSVAIPTWYDENHQPTKTYYDVMKKALDQWGNMNDVIYVMENDDVFDVIEDSNKTQIKFAIDELNKLNEELKRKHNTLYGVISLDGQTITERVRIGGKMEGIQLAMEEIRRQIKDLNDKLVYL